MISKIKEKYHGLVQAGGRGIIRIFENYIL